MKRPIFLFLLLCIGCAPLLQDDDSVSMRRAPRIGLVSALDHSNHFRAWNVAAELSQGIFVRLEKQPFGVFVAPEELERQRKFLSAADLVDLDLSFAERFRDLDFVILIDLIEYQAANVRKWGQRLNVSLRLRVIDLRSVKPELALQEILHRQDDLPLTEGEGKKPGEAGYTSSEVGSLHQRIIKDAATKIERALRARL